MAERGSRLWRAGMHPCTLSALDTTKSRLIARQKQPRLRVVPGQPGTWAAGSRTGPLLGPKPGASAHLTVAARRRGRRSASYDLGGRTLAPAAGDDLPALTAPNRHFAQRYFSLGGVAAASVRHLATEMNLARTEIEPTGRL